MRPVQFDQYFLFFYFLKAPAAFSWSLRSAPGLLCEAGGGAALLFTVPGAGLLGAVRTTADFAPSCWVSQSAWSVIGCGHCRGTVRPAGDSGVTRVVLVGHDTYPMDALQPGSEAGARCQGLLLESQCSLRSFFYVVRLCQVPPCARRLPDAGAFRTVRPSLTCRASARGSSEGQAP